MTSLRKPKGRPNPVDVFVGQRIAERRQALGLTQSELARAIGVTFQQVQKYEQGNNRVSASRLWLTAEFLGVSVNALVPAADEAVPSAEGPALSLTGRRIVAEAKALAPADQQLLAALLRRMVQTKPD